MASCLFTTEAQGLLLTPTIDAQHQYEYSEAK